MQAFLQNSPSAAHVSASSPLSAQAALIAKARVVEEMNRIQQRSYVTEQQRQQYMQAALGMDAPRLARTIIRSDRDAEEEVFSQARERWAAQQQQQQQQQEQERTGSAGSEGISSGGTGLDLNGSVSFLTGGELLLLEEHLRKEKARTEAADKDTAANSPHRQTSAGTAKRAQETQAAPDDDQDDLDQTVRVLRKPSSAEKRQGDEDALFCKTVEEVERVRKRFIQKASLPLLGSMSNVEHLSSSSLDTGVGGGGSGAGSRRDSGLRPSSSSGGSTGAVAEHAAAGGSVMGSIGAGLRRHASRLFNSGASAINSGVSGIARVRSGDSDDGVGQKKAPSTLSISTLDAEPSGSGGPYPILSPTQGRSPTKYILPKRAQRQSSGSSGADARPEMYRVDSSSLSPKPGRASGFGFDSPVEGRVKSIRVADSKSSTGPDYAGDGFDSYQSTRQPAGRDKRPRSRDREEMGDSLSHQQMVASSIDMLIGSKFNSERDMDTADEEQRLMGSSLVLLQQQLDSAAAANSSYRNLYGAAQQQPQGATKAAPAHYSQAAATALATLSRPASGGNQRLSALHVPVGGPGLADLRTDSFRLAGGGAASVGVQMLHTDDSTSSLGSNMFAFKAGERAFSWPASFFVLYSSDLSLPRFLLQPALRGETTVAERQHPQLRPQLLAGAVLRGRGQRPPAGGVPQYVRCASSAPRSWRRRQQRGQCGPQHQQLPLQCLLLQASHS
jgi:hypothetical protein